MKPPPPRFPAAGEGRGQRVTDCDRRIDGVAARTQNLRTRLRGEPLIGGDCSRPTASDGGVCVFGGGDRAHPENERGSERERNTGTQRHHADHRTKRERGSPPKHRRTAVRIGAMTSIAARLALSFALALLPAATRADDASSDPLAVTRRFLDAYAAGDASAVLSLVDPDVAIYGSDVAEVVNGKDALATLLANDQRLWQRAATIGAMTHVSIVTNDRLASLVFDAPFAIAGGPSRTVRFSMLWRRGSGGWRLVQESNAVPTVGQSAADLLKR